MHGTHTTQKLQKGKRYLGHHGANVNPLLMLFTVYVENFVTWALKINVNQNMLCVRKTVNKIGNTSSFNYAVFTESGVNVWSTWDSWQSCSSTCQPNSGRRMRARQCRNRESYNITDVSMCRRNSDGYELEMEDCVGFPRCRGSYYYKNTIPKSV